VAADGPEQLSHVAVGGPVDHADAPARPAHAQQLAGRLLLVGSEHGAAGRQDHVEGVVGERQGLGVALLEGRLQPFGVGAPAGAVQQRGHVVDADDLAEAAGGGQGGVAVAAGHVQNPLAGAQVDRLAQQLGGEEQPGADGGVVAGGPGGLLPLLDGDHIHDLSSDHRAPASRTGVLARSVPGSSSPVVRLITALVLNFVSSQATRSGVARRGAWRRSSRSQPSRRRRCRAQERDLGLPEPAADDRPRGQERSVVRLSPTTS